MRKSEPTPGQVNRSPDAAQAGGEGEDAPASPALTELRERLSSLFSAYFEGAAS